MYLRESNVNAKLGPSALSKLIFDVASTDSGIVLITAVSPAKVDFLETVKEMRWASKAVKMRPTTASRLERVKYRWKNQSIVWAFTLWKGAVNDSLQIKQANTIRNLTEELTFQKSEARRLEGDLRRMAEEGLGYVSGGDEAPPSDDDDEAGDLYLAQKKALERMIGKDVVRAKQREEGELLAAVTAKLRYAQAQLTNAESNNMSLSKALRAERGRDRPAGGTGRRAGRKEGGKMPELQVSSRAVRLALPRPPFICRVRARAWRTLCPSPTRLLAPSSHSCILFSIFVLAPSFRICRLPTPQISTLGCSPSLHRPLPFAGDCHVLCLSRVPQPEPKPSLDAGPNLLPACTPLVCLGGPRRLPPKDGAHWGRQAVADRRQARGQHGGHAAGEQEAGHGLGMAVRTRDGGEGTRVARVLGSRPWTRDGGGDSGLGRGRPTDVRGICAITRVCHEAASMKTTQLQ